MRPSIHWIVGVFAVVFLLTSCENGNQAASNMRQKQPTYAGTIVAVGDSLTAGLGVDEEKAFPALLENKLRENGYAWRVVNAGISGETSSGALSRVNWILKLKPDIVILATGANDGLRGIDPVIIRKNIDEIIGILKENNVTVVLAGMRMVANLGREYTDDFAALYPAVAGKHKVTMIPFFLSGVAGNPSLNQRDGIHPTAEGYRIIADTVYPYIEKAIREKNARSNLMNS